MVLRPSKTLRSPCIIRWESCLSPNLPTVFFEEAFFLWNINSDVDFSCIHDILLLANANKFLIEPFKQLFELCQAHLIDLCFMTSLSNFDFSRKESVSFKYRLLFFVHLVNSLTCSFCHRTATKIKFTPTKFSSILINLILEIFILWNIQERKHMKKK